MNMKGKADIINLVNSLNSKYGIAATTLHSLSLGAYMDASMYKAETHDGRSYLVKLKRGLHSDISVVLLALLQVIAHKERDLMFIGNGVAHEKIMLDIAEHGQALLLTPAGGENRLEMFTQFKDIFKPNDVVDIEFKKDKGLALYG